MRLEGWPQAHARCPSFETGILGEAGPQRPAIRRLQPLEAHGEDRIEQGIFDQLAGRAAAGRALQLVGGGRATLEALYGADVNPRVMNEPRIVRMTERIGPVNEHCRSAVPIRNGACVSESEGGQILTDWQRRVGIE